MASRGQHITGKQLNASALKLYFPNMFSLGVVSSFTDNKSLSPALVVTPKARAPRISMVKCRTLSLISVWDIPWVMSLLRTVKWISIGLGAIPDVSVVME